MTSRIARARELGLGKTAAAGLRLGGVAVRNARRRARARVRPPRAEWAEVAAAIGGDARDVLRSRVLEALPTVAAWERDLGPEIVAAAEAIRAHRFDLLGSGPVELGAEIDWLRDFKSGSRWEPVHATRVPLVRGDGSDIKVPWELSRGQHLPLLAAAQRVTGDGVYRDELGAQLRSWIAGNPLELGPNWACTMEVAIRAANWLAALTVAARDGADEPWFREALAGLLLHCRFIRANPEWTRVRANHYLADVVGLLLTASLFAESAEGREWIQWCVGELERELEHQVRADGCDHEASTSYHRLVAELFVCGTQAADALAPGRLGPAYRSRLARMLDFVADYTRPDGVAPRIGDADDGRFLPLGDYGADPGSHLHLFRQAGQTYVPPSHSAAYPDGGFYILRNPLVHLVVRCGDTGVGGLGWHAHNDQLAFELTYDGVPLVVDPGAAVYTSDPETYTRFRSTAWHATLSLDGLEQNPLSAQRMFQLPDRSRAELVHFDDRSFAGRHHGFSPALHTRAIELVEGAILVVDTIDSEREHDAEWTFPLAPGDAVAEGGAVVATRGRIRLELAAEGVEWRIEEGAVAPRYGITAAAPFARARRRTRRGSDTTRFVLRAEQRG